MDAWRESAACAGHAPRQYFPRELSGESSEEGTYPICVTCPVRLDCLTYALNSGQQCGVWGGYNVESRRQRENARRWLNRRGVPAMDPRRRTPELLEEVAQVWRSAVSAFLPPTRAVMEHFDRPYSTAQKWVHDARAEGLLNA